MKVVRLSRREFKEKCKEGWLDDPQALTERERGKEAVVYIPGRASTHEMLHEIYHAKYSPQLERVEAGEKWNTPDQFAEEEVNADAFAYERMGKDFSFESLVGVARVMLDWGYKPATAMGSITRALDKADYLPLDKKSRSALWQFMRDYQKGTD